MEKKKTPDLKNKKVMIVACVFVIAIVLLGISLTYAYFTVRYTGSGTVTPNAAAKMNVTSTLTSATAINASQMSLINADEVGTKAKTVNFSVTNANDSNVNAKYTINLVDFSFSKNLSSKYFKWKLVVNPGKGTERTITGDFLDSAIASEGTSDTTVVSNLTKVLVPETNALPLSIGATDNLIFYIWLENDPVIDQIYLTNGSFNGKLSLEAIPSK